VVDSAMSMPDDAHRALLLLDRPILVDLVELTLNHGLFVVRSASTLEDAASILVVGPRTSRWSTWITSRAANFWRALARPTP
jgi:hypothetical protein